MVELKEKGWQKREGILSRCLMPLQIDDGLFVKPRHWIQKQKLFVNFQGSSGERKYFMSGSKKLREDKEIHVNSPFAS
jgi:hypothetical protein